MSDAVPSFLTSAAAKARARAAAARQAITTAPQALNQPETQPIRPNVVELSQTSPGHPTQAPAQPVSAKPAKAEKPPKPLKAVGKPGKGKSEGKSALEGAVSMLEQLEPLEVIEFFRTHSPNTAAFEIVAPHLPAVMAAVMTGAVIKGVAGHQDRMTLFRMLGAPWTPNTAQGERGQQVEALADRFVRAVARVERRLSGHISVTDEVLTISHTALEAEVVG